MIEFCESKKQYANSTFETLEGRLGKDATDGEYIIDHFETKGIVESPIF